MENALDLHKKNHFIRDLAIVIIIIVGLAAYVGNQFKHIRDKSRESNCASNIMQLCSGIEMYSKDYDQKLPPAEKWSDAIYPLVKQSRGTFLCPADRIRYYGDHHQSSSFSFHNKLDKASLKSIAKPASIPMLFDSTGGWNSILSISDAVPRHSGGYNCGFADGHIKWVRK